MNINDLIFTGFNRRVAALNRNTGVLVWQWRAPQGSLYTTLLLDGDVLVVSVDGYMYGLNPYSGDLLWSNPMSGFGTGVASLVSVNGVGSNSSLPAAAAARAAQAAAGAAAAH
jgi:outer membrane protein assembly factor BamB